MERSLSGLFVCRPLLDSAPFRSWATGHGFHDQVDDLHATVVYSRAPVLLRPLDDGVEIRGGPRLVKPLGGRGAVVLGFWSEALFMRWREARDAGASWDYDSYRPHVTITWRGGDVDLATVRPYEGPLKLGPEVHSLLDPDWRPSP